jgi:hypothetical protein
MNMAEDLIKPSTTGYYQMMKGYAETSSFIPNIKTEYPAITVTIPNQLSTSALSNKGLHDWENLGIHFKHHEMANLYGNIQMQLLDLLKRPRYEKIIDYFQQEQINAEK